MKILVLGCKGQLGRCLNDQLINTDHEVIFTSRDQIDIIDFKQTKNQILKISPDLIINATAYTSVDKAEENQKTANLINHLAVKNIADICNQQDCWLIHISTDYVFDGKAKIPYKESDITNPQSVYGETKHNGELAIQASDCKYIIIRTAWVFSEYGNNFLKTMMRLGANSDKLNIVSDQIGCPTYAQDIAKAIRIILPQLNKNEVQGVYHYCGDESTTWFEFATLIFEIASSQGRKIPASLNAICTFEFPTPAKRPKYSVLDCGKISTIFGVSSSNWKKSIYYILGKI
jgi:dTDP-4-dehydrorhamnose reductase